MAEELVVADSSRDLLIDLFCCVIAADKRVSGREVQLVGETLERIGAAPEPEALRATVQECCKAIHKQGINVYVPQALARASAIAGTPLASLFIEVQDALLNADGQCTAEELEISRRIVAALGASQASTSAVELEHSASSEQNHRGGGTLRGTAKSSLALAGAAAERTKLTTISLPAAYLELGKHCYAARAFADAFAPQYDMLDKAMSAIKSTTEKLAATSDATGFAAKAKELAGKGALLALAKKQDLQYRKHLHDLGKAVYASKESGSGPKELCDGIAVIRNRIAVLDSSVARKSNELRAAASSVGKNVSLRNSKGMTRGWLQSAWVIAPLAAFVAPVGLILLWRHPVWSRRTKITGTVASLIMLGIIGQATDKASDGESSSGQSTAAVSSASTAEADAAHLKKVRALAERVRNGMKYHEVIRLLGKPEKSNKVSIKGSPEKITCWYCDGCLSITFTESFGVPGGRVTDVLSGLHRGYEPSSYEPTVMKERGRGGPGADRAVQNLIDSGNYSREAERNIRNMSETYDRLKGNK